MPRHLDDVESAFDRVPDGAILVASPGCGTPETLLNALPVLASARPGLRLFSGLLLGRYPFLDSVEQGALRYDTFHVMPPVRGLVESGVVGYLPLRATSVRSVLSEWARRGPIVALVRVSPPDADGWCSLGPSVSYPAAAVEVASVVVAEVADDVPTTYGDSLVHETSITAMVPSTTPMASYRSPKRDATSDAIADHVLGILPPKPTIQLGIGAVPETIASRLVGAGLGPLRFVGMGAEPLVDLDDAGELDDAPVPNPTVVAAELMGSPRLMRWAHRNSRVGVYASERAHEPGVLGACERLVSVNSAFQVDLTGQVNSEAASGRQLSGVGGSHDYVEAARRSPGGLRVVALPSTTSDGSTSRLVPALPSGTPVTIPRSLVDVVVTEHGVARLGSRTLAERAEALISIAHPDHRDQIADAWRQPHGMPRRPDPEGTG